MLFVRAYPRETQEMVFDAHNRAFAFFKGTCTRGIYDNMKTAVDAVFIGKDRQFNRRFLRMCGHPGRAHCLHAGLGLGEGPG
jgi:transposase